MWWYREPSIIDTFLEACDLNGRIVVPFATSGGSELGESALNMQKIAPKATVKQGKRFSAHASEAELTEWAQKFLEETL